MLVTFKSRGHADVIMFGDVALKLIRMMGRPERVPGTIESEDIPVALKSLQQAIAAEDPTAVQKEADGDDDDEEEPVSTHNRALPLVELLNAARDAEVPVMWEKGGRSY